MYLPILSATVLGLAALSITGGDVASIQSGSASSKAQGADALVGQTLWATEDPIARWGDPVRAEELSLEGLGRVSEIVTTPEGRPFSVVVAVGGLWGFGAQEVELGSERLHLIPGADGQQHLVVDLSAQGAEPPIDGAEL
jgi:hypothetical protein